MRIDTPRLLLRPFCEGDLEDFFAYCSQEGVGEAAGWKHHTSREESRAELEKKMHDAQDTCAIVWKGDGHVAGHITAYPDSEEGRPDVKELGFVLSRAYQRRGIMTEAVEAVLKALFERGAQRVYACCFTDNEASRRLIEKCGFAREGEGSFYSESLNKNFSSYEYVYHRADWCAREGDRT
ncbi:MAG: GNAT family protein [Eubacteriales bacterium]|nr:GNAT family protein [Eubacteriales bacterium]